MTRITVAIPSWNGRHHLGQCLPALAAQGAPGTRGEVLVLDNGSDDGTGTWLAREHPGVRVLREDRNIGFAAACNRLVQEAVTPWVALLNNDTVPGNDWLAAFEDAAAWAPTDVVSVAGKMADWSGARLDFAGGVLTFDGHALHRDHQRSLQEAHTPVTDSELLFACAGNAMVRRERFLELGGFDAAYFAYFEDVDFGWRAWAAGNRITFCPDAGVRHRSSATSDSLGNERRGFLLERNAYWTACKNYDDGLWPRMRPAILMTLLSRVEALIALRNAGGERLRHTMLNGSGGSPSSAILRRLLRRLAPDAAVTLRDAQTLAQLRALSCILRQADAGPDRGRWQRLRRVPDADIFARFPLHVVSTYPGDAELFGSTMFRELMPGDLPVVYRRFQELSFA